MENAVNENKWSLYHLKALSSYEMRILKRQNIKIYKLYKVENKSLVELPLPGFVC